MRSLLLAAFLCACTPDPESICDDEVDNDGNGLVDCDDPGCRDDAACAEGDADTDTDGDSDTDADTDADADTDSDTDTDVPVDGDGDGYASDVDCDDGDAAVHPGADEVVADGADQDCDGGDLCYQDEDGDGFGTTTTVVSADLDCADVGESAVDTDCDDGSDQVNPAASESAADGLDQDCDGLELCYEDADGDGYGSTTTIASADLDCDGAGESALPTDHDDTDPWSYPGAEEIPADGVDQDGDGGDDCYADLDGDGFGTSVTIASADLDCTDTGEATVDGDCDDAAADTFPGADEYCDGADNDCDGATDEPDALDALRWHADTDGDGWGDPLAATTACEPPSGYVADGTDCDDGAAYVHPGATEVVADGLDQDCDGGDLCYEDLDGDGFGTSATIASADLDCAGTGEAADDGDCDDAAADTFPGADEYCDGADNDCDGATDEPDALDALRWYADTDGDGWGDPLTAATACEPPTGYVADGTDCDDGDAAVNPDASEVVADGLDQDCDGGDLCYEDADGDGYGGTATVASTDLDCEEAGEASDAEDCDDGDPSVNPGASEICGNGVDDDCDGAAGGCGWSGVISLADADGEIAFSGYSEGSVGDAEGGGDVDGDGRDDLAVAIPYANSNGYEAGVAYVFLGPATGTLTEADADATFVGHADYDYIGRSLSLDGDLTGDGLSDLLLGAPCAAPDCSSGEVYGYSGPTLGQFLTITDDGPAPNYFGGIEFGVQHVPDITGDGLDEVIVPATGDPGGNGAWFYYSSPVTGTTWSSYADATVSFGSWAGGVQSGFDFDGDGSQDILFQAWVNSTVWLLDASLLTTGGTIGVGDATYEWSMTSGDGLGWAASPVGDIDQDGYADLLIGAWSDDADATNAGRAYLFYGPDASQVGEIGGAGTDDHLSLTAAGDFNGDGIPDFTVGSYYRDGIGTDAGAAWVFFGPVEPGTLSIADAQAMFLGESADDYAGAVGTAGDVDGDGYDDLFISAAGRGVQGSVYVLLGESGL